MTARFAVLLLLSGCGLVPRTGGSCGDPLPATVVEDGSYVAVPGADDLFPNGAEITVDGDDVTLSYIDDDQQLVEVALDVVAGRLP